MSDNLFERASRIGLRVASSKGMLMVEDLWSIPLTSKTGALNLDEIAGELNKQLENCGGSSVGESVAARSMKAS